MTPAGPQTAVLVEPSLDLSHLFVVEVHSKHPEAEVRSGVLRAVNRFAELAVELLGREEVRARFEDIARNNPLADGKIPLYFRDGIQPHNIQVGVPYTGIELSSLPGSSAAQPEYETIVIHEVGHLFFGKFNDALAEPIADLFKPENPGTEELDRLALRVLRSGQHKEYFGLEKLFSYQPTATLEMCSFYHRKRAAGLDKLAARRETARFLWEVTNAENIAFHALLENPFARPGQPTEAEVNALEGVIQTKQAQLAPKYLDERFPSRPFNPNEIEGGGPIRMMLYALGSAVQRMMIATRGVKAYLEFYYAPNARTLSGMGIEGFAGLEHTVAAWLLSERGEGKPTGTAAQALDCFEEFSGDVRDCLSKAGGRKRSRKKGGGPTLASQDFQVPRGPGTEAPASARIGLKVTEKLGVDLDLERLCGEHLRSTPFPDWQEMHPGAPQ